jgi:hypothetical protein
MSCDCDGVLRCFKSAMLFSAVCSFPLARCRNTIGAAYDTSRQEYLNEHSGMWSNEWLSSTGLISVGCIQHATRERGAGCLLDFLISVCQLEMDSPANHLVCCNVNSLDPSTKTCGSRAWNVHMLLHCSISSITALQLCGLQLCTTSACNCIIASARCALHHCTSCRCDGCAGALPIVAITHVQYKCIAGCYTVDITLLTVLQDLAYATSKHATCVSGTKRTR